MADIGDRDLFIGHEWLKLHSPDINWRESTLRFVRCPPSCGYTTRIEDPDADEPEDFAPLEEGDRLYVLDTEAYIRTNTKTHIR